MEILWNWPVCVLLRGGRWGVSLNTSLCLRSLGLIRAPLLGARLPWAMSPWPQSYVNKIFTYTGGVSFSYLSPFLFRFILSCLRSSFSIKDETDRDRTAVFLTILVPGCKSCQIILKRSRTFVFICYCSLQFWLKISHFSFHSIREDKDKVCVCSKLCVFGLYGLAHQ